MEHFKTIKASGFFEESIKKSRFICHIKRVSTEEDGKNFVNAIKKEHYKANHSCFAMIIGNNSQIKRSSDDGEPSGTAGIPILSVLEKQCLTNVVVVVTRYFGGIKLGTGGLIRAYSNMTATAIKRFGIIEVKQQIGLEITLSYPQYQLYSNLLDQLDLTETETKFSDTIKTTLYCDTERVENLIDTLTNYYHGQISCEKIGSKVIEFPCD
ncbi:YigZ family protein [Streptococcus pyogenes]|uniref:YigZ family protein n=1 Tax=Streptococcus pyogenes TaxID=1314 RepID=UPI0004BE40AE|nr:YigZ family protein [Streptococcus pyogenes]HER4679269.1 YigZ family protein [Streptococcus pyogenes NGAS340]HER4736745.1 YigZ family protein [Streptococcus pyogenes NGAS311]HER4836712.1 YigZ family protein [Streptococcus pyogenes NGAS005]QCK56317.1 YigZ family protein [Streptococcus pyogenes]UEN78201.1 YigZ family protein [Streptococcus pyogenes]